MNNSKQLSKKDCCISLNKKETVATAP